MGTDRGFSAFITFGCDTFGLDAFVGCEIILDVLLWTADGDIRLVTGGFGLFGTLLVATFLIVDDGVLIVLVRAFGDCSNAFKNSRCRTLLNASKTTVCGQAPVYKTRTIVSLLDFAVGVQTSNKHDEYQWCNGIIEEEGSRSRIGI